MAGTQVCHITSPLEALLLSSVKRESTADLAEFSGRSVMFGKVSAEWITHSRCSVNTPTQRSRF